MRKKLTSDFHAGDSVTPNADLLLQVHDASDDSIISTANYAAIGSVNTPGTDGANFVASLAGSVITLDGVDLGDPLPTFIKIRCKDADGMESILSDAFQIAMPELMRNWDFSEGDVGYETSQSGWTFAGSQATYDRIGGSSALIQINLPIIGGKTYYVVIDVASNQGIEANFVILGGTDIVNIHLDAGIHTFENIIAGSDTYIYIYGRSGDIFVLNSISVKEKL